MIYNDINPKCIVSSQKEDLNQPFYTRPAVDIIGINAKCYECLLEVVFTSLLWQDS